MARLIVLSGLPGSGKSTLAKGLSDLSGAILLRVDVFEQDLRNVNSSDFDVGKDTKLATTMPGAIFWKAKT